MNRKQIVSIVAYYLLPIALLAVLLMNPDEHFFVELGGTALTLLIIILFVKPLTVLFPHKILKYILSLRRELGVTCFWVFLFHGTGLIYVEKLQLDDFYGLGNYLFGGAVGGIGMILLGITSNDFSVKILKKKFTTLPTSSCLPEHCMVQWLRER